MATYTTSAKVRSEAGFDGNYNIHEPVIERYLEQAEAYVKSFIAGRYALASLTTNFTGSQAETTLSRITELLAAGFLLQKEYGSDAQDTDKDGYKKQEEALAMLKDITTGTLKLIDSLGNEYPNYSSASHSSIAHTIPTLEDSPRRFSMGQKF